MLIYLAFLPDPWSSYCSNGICCRRASKLSAALSFNLLEPKGTKWHLTRYAALAGKLYADDVLYHGSRMDDLLFH